MLVQPVNNYQNNYYNNSFKAQIIKTEYLMKGLEHAKQKPLNIQAGFITMLEHIKRDKNIGMFYIFNEKNGENTVSVIQADDKQYTNPHDELGFVSFAKDKDGNWSLPDGGLCVAAIEEFIEKHYGKSTANRLIHRGENHYGCDKVKQLGSKIRHTANAQQIQVFNRKIDLIEQNTKKELAERYSSFEASLTDLNQVMN